MEGKYIKEFNSSLSNIVVQEIAQQEFDLIVTQEDIIKRAKNAAKIQNNIRRNR